jgi:hypothetical protein
VYTGFWLGNLWGRDHLEDRGLDRRTILRWIFRKSEGGGGNGVDISGSGEGQVVALVNALMNFWVPYNVGNFFTS